MPDRLGGGRRGPRRRRAWVTVRCRARRHSAGRRRQAVPMRRSAASRRYSVAWRHVWPVRVDPQRGRPGDAVRGARRRPRTALVAGLQPRADRPGADRAAFAPARPAGCSPSARWGLVPAVVDGRPRRRADDQRAGRDGRDVEGVRARRSPAPVPGAGRRLVRVGPRPTDGKQPYFMTRSDGEPVVFGGIWSTWGTARARRCSRSASSRCRRSGDLPRVHDRMPLVLPPDRGGRDWLHGTDAGARCSPPPSERVRWPASSCVRSCRCGGRRPQRRTGLSIAPRRRDAPTQSTVDDRRCFERD